MKKLNTMLKCLNKLLLSDKFLLIFMVILIIQAIYNMFFNEISAHQTSDIDIVIRTTTASIFGYFISSSFQNNYDKSNELSDSSITNQTHNVYVESKNLTSNEPKTLQIGFSSEDDNNLLQANYAKTSTDKNINKKLCLQTVIVSSIGIFSLVVFIIARNHMPQTAEATATLTQLRDFISASVGFLIGKSKKV